MKETWLGLHGDIILPTDPWAKQAKHLAYCQWCVEIKEEFDNITFTNETKIQIENFVSLGILAPFHVWLDGTI